MELTHQAPWMRVDLGQPHRVLSWALVGGGLRVSDAVIWRQVRDRELGPQVDASALLREGMAERGCPDGVGLLTSANLDRVVVRERSVDGVVARCVATVGLGNRLRVGDPPGSAPVAGTINLLVQVDQVLSEKALLEAMSLVVEARTVAVLSLGVESVRSGERASGTGTDCVVVAGRIGESGLPFAGKHTALGSAIGGAVMDAVLAGGRACLS